MPRKKVDARVRTLIENGVKSRTRSFFVVVGDRGKDQVVNLHYILSKAQVKARPSVLWCFNKELGFSTHRQKRMREIKKLQARGLYDPEKEDPFELFISGTQIRWCYYKESTRILGSTYGMLVLQDFESITPNILCRTMETVEGGGVVVLLLRTMSSLRQLYTMTMEVHSRFRTEAHGDVVPRFNERFLLSLASCPVCLVLDDELNVLPISRHAKSIVPLPGTSAATSASSSADALALSESGLGIEPDMTEAEKELRDLKSSLASTELVGALVPCTKTLDQAKAVLTFAEAISEKTLRSTVALTAGRGRGKSAALGLAIAAAVGYGYANIFVTSPSPENLKTLFEFVFVGLEALAFKQHADYEAVASTNPEFNHAIVRVNIFRGHRQTIQYIEPHDADKLSQAELVVIDEAAAIPLPLVKKLLGPYLVFLASTVNGYEGTGRSLSLKLIQQLRQQSSSSAGVSVGGAGAAASGGGSGSSASAGAATSYLGRTFREVTLSEPIRYSSGDGVEAWLNDLLCLDATTPYRLTGGLPAPRECQLYAVDRDALFSYHRISETMLHRMMSLYVSSHYKNTPNDLQLLSDAPAHRLFVLLGPRKDDGAGLPDILVVIQVCLEGKISRDSLRAAMSRGMRSSGDLIPWTVSQQFQDDGFASLSGARVVRIATHPDAVKMGYGSRALELLGQFYEGKMVNYADGDDDDSDEDDIQVDRGYAARAAADSDDDEDGGGKSLQTEKLKPRKQLPPLLVPLGDIRRPERLHWLGVSYGLTLQLFNFWRRSGYLPVYLRQTANDLTAEHTMVMLRPLDCSDIRDGTAPQGGWHAGFVADFARRYMQLLGFEFRNFDTTLALSIMDAACSVTGGFVTSAKADDDDDAGASSSSSGGGGAGAKGGAGDASAPSPSAALVSSSGRTPGSGGLTMREINMFFTPHDMKRLESYARNLVDYHMILDLLPDVSRLFFQGRLPDVHLSRLQASILLAVGLQRVPIETVCAHFNVQANQVLALFNKAVRKASNSMKAAAEAAAAEALDADMRDRISSKKAGVAAGGAGAGSGSASKAAAVTSSSSSGGSSGGVSKAAVAALLKDEELSRYAVPADEAWDEALSKRSKGSSRIELEGGGAPGADAVPTSISVRKPAPSPAAHGGAGGGAGNKRGREGGDDRPDKKHHKHEHKAKKHKAGSD